MSLEEIANGASVLVDSNIFLYWLTGRSPQCGRFLRRCVEGAVKGYISTLSLTEVAHRLMLLEARENGWADGPNPVRTLQERPERVRALIRYEERLRDILLLQLQVENLQLVDFSESLSMRRRYGLLTNDSILLATAARLRIKEIASADKRLERAAEYNIYAPSDL